MRESDLNQRPSGYEPDELPDCSIPQQKQTTRINFLVKSWCGRGDLNPHARRHYHLKVACLPIPPPPQLVGRILVLPTTKGKPYFELLTRFWCSWRSFRQCSWCWRSSLYSFQTICLCSLLFCKNS